MLHEHIRPHRQRPIHVLRAIAEHDIAALKEMGRRGGRVSGPVNIKILQRVNAEQRRLADINASEIEFSMMARAEEANENICPIDSEEESRELGRRKVHKKVMELPW